jgi:hypothetical protein
MKDREYIVVPDPEAGVIQNAAIRSKMAWGKPQKPADATKMQPSIVFIVTLKCCARDVSRLGCRWPKTTRT